MGRICFFNTTPFWGGGEKWHLEAAAALQERGHPVVLVGGPDSPLVSRARSRGVETAEFAVGNLSWLDPVKRRRIRRFFVEKGVGTVLFNGPADLKTGGLAARAAGIPRRIYRRGLALPVRDRWLNRYLFTHVLTHVIANSEETRRLLFRDLGPLLSPDRVAVIPNGIDLDEFDRLAREKEAPGEPPTGVVGTVGRLTRQKNHAALLEVARILADDGVDFTIRIAGDGELAASLRDRAQELELEGRVEFTGFSENVPAFLQGIDVFVLTSSWEGFGYVLVEAGAAGCPAVAFDLSSNPEVVRDGVTGYLVPPGDLRQFADRVRELIEQTALRDRMGTAAREDVENRFTLEGATDQLERFLELERSVD